MIRTLYWDDVTAVDAPWAPLAVGRILALLPGPTDHEACLQAAGFADFADSDQRWHSDFVLLLDGVVEYGKRFGQPRLTSGERPVSSGLLSRIAPRPKPGVIDTAVCAALDDRFPPCQIEFGEPSAMALRTADGHPLIWLWEQSAAQAATSIVSMLAQGRPTKQARLQWAALVESTGGRTKS